MPDQLPLRDIHLPEPVSWFPPATGWWILSIIITIIFVLLWWWSRKPGKRVLNKRAKVEIEAVIESYQNHRDRRLFIQALSAALKRIGMSYFPRDEVAGLSGVKWLQRLNSLAATNRMDDALLKLLVAAPYQRSPDLGDDEVQALIQQVRRWAAALPRLKTETAHV